MRARWHALNSELLRSTTFNSFQIRYDEMRRAHTCLARFRVPAGLLDFMHARGDPEPCNEVLRRLVITAQAGGSAAQPAVTLALLALWPGLDAVRGRLRRFAIDPDELAGDLVSRLTLGIKTMDPRRVSRIAATLLRNVERDFKRSIQRRNRDEPLDEELIAAAPAPDEEAARGDVLNHLRDVIGDDVDLVIAVAIHGFTQREAAQRLGISHAAARKRYQRALDRLRDTRIDLL